MHPLIVIVGSAMCFALIVGAVVYALASTIEQTRSYDDSVINHGGDDE